MAMHATVLSHVTIGDDVMVGAGAVISEGKTIESNKIVLGVPGKVIRDVTEAELQRIKLNASGYEYLAREHRESLHMAGIVLDSDTSSH